MSQLRQDISTREWVIIATDRAKRPKDFTEKEAEVRETTSANCPFCEGNESATPPEVLAYREPGTEPDKPGWRVRVIPNKFPALMPAGSERRKKQGVYQTMDGLGKHEVIVETPQHNKTIGTMEVGEVEEVILAYRDRYIALNQDRKFMLVTIFRNHGKRAGTSLSHSHSQLIATPIVPANVRHRLEEALRYYDYNGQCVYCDILRYELKSKDRLVMENEDYVAFEPFASRSPFETWIVPRRHESSFGNIGGREIETLAEILQGTLAKLYRSLNNPDYNYTIRTAPHHEAGEPHYHWHIQILPRLTTRAGFEIGSGIYINVAYPEETAEFLRAA